MIRNESSLHLMKVHVFKSEEERAAAMLAGLIGENDLVITPDPGTVDSVMSDSSLNPVQNCTVKRYVDSAIEAALGRL